MKNLVKKGLACLMAAAVITSSLAFTATAADEGETKSANRYGLAENIKDGAILHAWSWSFNTIKNNMKLIAQSGYTSVQTSPINEIKVGDNGGMQLYGNGKWYYQYQPSSYNIGNYQLGTEQEFKDMCAEADKYGVKIIVDAVVNHCSSDYSVISNSIKNLEGGGFHERVEIENWSDRYQVTQGKLSGLYDLNTQNPNVQQMILDYLKRCVADGADGFRYDAAKHIELPDDPESYAGDFWNVITKNGAEFQYGEILQGQSDRITAYANYINVTASTFGQELRNAVNKKSTSRRLLSGYYVSTSVPTDKLVTWVESHDNYTDGTWKTIDNSNVRKAWALICAKGDTTPLFFSRPAGSSTTSEWGNNLIGARGDDNFFHPEVVEVNKFRNAMVGESVSATNVNGDYGCLKVERGNKGVVIINLKDSDFELNCDTALEDGEYKEAISGTKYTVKDGKLEGSVGAGQILVLYHKPAGMNMLGDVDLNKKIDISDVTATQMNIAKLLELDVEAELNADVDRNNKIDISDVTYIQMYIAQIIEDFDELQQ